MYQLRLYYIMLWEGVDDMVRYTNPICTIFSFPEGTTRTEEMLRTHSEPYRIELPDGYLLHESFDRERELSFLEYLPE